MLSEAFKWFLDGTDGHHGPIISPQLVVTKLVKELPSVLKAEISLKRSQMPTTGHYTKVN
jgi:hypothetical protein